MDFETVTASLAIAGMIVAEVIYLRDTFRGKTKPHAFSWLIWATLMYINGAIQWFEGASVAGSATIFGGTLCLAVALLAVLKGEKNITKSDWLCFLAALGAIPLWLATSDPFYSAALITCIDGLGYVPTYRKSWSSPKEETLSMYIYSATTDFFICLSIVPLTATAALYPASGLLSNGGLALMLILRRIHFSKIAQRGAKLIRLSNPSCLLIPTRVRYQPIVKNYTRIATVQNKNIVL